MAPGDRKRAWGCGLSPSGRCKEMTGILVVVKRSGGGEAPAAGGRE